MADRCTPEPYRRHSLNTGGFLSDRKPLHTKQNALLSALFRMQSYRRTEQLESHEPHSHY
ncbi:MAG: hypothetical protein K0S95_1551 [Pantoea eucrina]|jgi:hypothetical protein|nr:hypothetical protein [Pantoea eucrina]